MKPTEPSLVQAPPLLCSFPITAHTPPPPPCQLRAGNSCSLQEPLQLARINIRATASAIGEKRSRVNSEKLQSCVKLCSSTANSSTMKESLTAGQVGSQGVTSKDVFMQSSDAVPATSQSSFRNRSQFPGFQLGMVFL